MAEDTGPVEDWQQRALTAEQKAGELATALAAQQRTHRLDIELMTAGAIDVDAARLLAQAACGDDPDISKAVSDLKQDKPFLFRTRPQPPGAMGAAAQPDDPLMRVAEHARSTGDRRSLLHYLRLKRGA